jgi:hypothetical protein
LLYVTNKQAYLQKVEKFFVSKEKSFIGLAPWSQFHQHVLQIFFKQKNYKRKTVSREKLCKTLLNEKSAHKMLVKLTAVNNLTKILRAAF